ncbi:MAG: YlbF family regulator [Bacillota bacterium]
MATYDKAHELARDLKSSSEYKDYQRAKQELLANEAALSILKDYQKKRLTFEMELLSGKTPDSAKKEELDKITELVNMHGGVKRFLDAEQRVMIMMTDIQRILTEALDLLDYR